MRRMLVLTALSLSLLSLRVLADQVTLKNGDRLSGTIVKSDEDAKTVLLKTDLAGDVTIKWDAVTAIMSSQPLHIILSDGRVIVGRVTTTDGTLEITTDGGTVPAARDAVKAIRDNATQAEIDRLQHPRLLDYWNGLFDLGLSLTEGNSSTSALTIAGKASRVVPKNKLTLYYTEVYSRDSNETPALTTANAIHGGVRDDFNLTAKLYAFGFTDFDEDALQHLDLRNVLGGGLGSHIVNTKQAQFDVFGGASFNQEYFASYTTANPAPPPVLLLEPSQTRHSAEIVAGESLSTKLGPRTTLSEQLSFFPNLSSVGDYRITLDANASTKLKTWLGWQVTVSDRYISDPPFGLKGNDFLLSTGLRLTFGKGIF
jgi:putative salt-induced outer membrane protein YdiY/small nuclear ribonucleoprotein (snRNP)-like protein